MLKARRRAEVTVVCTGLAAWVVALDDATGVLMGTVDRDGRTQRICFAYLPDVVVGELVLVHSGFAIGRLGEDDALELQRVLDGVHGVEGADR